MKILVIHQNFPGQYKHLAPALVAQGHTVVALTLRVKEYTKWKGVSIFPYKVTRGSGKTVHPWLTDFETKLLRAEACHDAAVMLRDRKGFYPDVILGHPGWGETMFLRDVWPAARLGLYCEFFYRGGPPYTGFDPEFPPRAASKDALRLRMKNINNTLHFQVADKGISPTAFQADTFPDPFRKKISVIHDGVNTRILAPNPAASFTVQDGPRLTRNDEVITFVNRNLEPYRGYHVFMRALPELLKARPNARVVIVGGDGVSYGEKPPVGKTWKQIYIDEVRDQIPDADWARVHFVGSLPYSQFIALLQVSRLHIYLTYPFVLSWSLLETMSVEGTILASDTAPVRELIEDGVTGALVDFFDTDALVEKASALLDDPETSARLGQAARAHVQQGYDLETVCMPRQLQWVSDLADLPPQDLPV